jgi:ComF family protein
MRLTSTTATETRKNGFGFLLSNNLLNEIKKNLLDLLFPRCCAGCGRVDDGWCLHCQQELDAVPIENLHHGDSVEIIATGIHKNKLQQAVHALKYENLPELCHPLGQRLIARLKNADWAIDLIVPIPMHPTRLKHRGYNQAQLLAEVVATGLSIPHVPTAIERTTETISQVGLSAEERKKNVANTFSANVDIIAEKNILLVDDVCTTGETITACTHAALAAGANKIYGLTVTTPQLQ